MTIDPRIDFINDLVDAIAAFPFADMVKGTHPRLPDFVAGFLMGRGYRKISTLAPVGTGDNGS